MIVNGRKLADEILADLKDKIAKLPPLTAGAVLVDESAASESFLKQKAKAAEFFGANFKILKFNSKITTGKLLKEIAKLNRNRNINGIIVQLPLPKHINAEKILAIINPKKDIDALSPKPLVLAPTVEAVKYVFEKYKISPKNKNILIIGKGRLVGQPIYNWLLSENKRVKAIDIKQKHQLPKLAPLANIIISGVGKAGLIKGDMVKKGAILIDFGFGRKNGPPGGEVNKISGDFDFTSCAKKAKLITPVPGGMGPIMVAMLFRNLFKLNKL